MILIKVLELLIFFWKIAVQSNLPFNCKQIKWYPYLIIYNNIKKLFVYCKVLSASCYCNNIFYLFYSIYIYITFNNVNFEFFFNALISSLRDRQVKYYLKPSLPAAFETRHINNNKNKTDVTSCWHKFMLYNESVNGTMMPTLTHTLTVICIRRSFHQFVVMPANPVDETRLPRNYSHSLKLVCY